MPWDVFSASRQGSVRPFGSAAAGMPSSAGGLGRGFELGPPSLLSRRGSRLTTASPLQGRGPPLPLSQRISILSTPDRAGLTTSGALGEDDEMLGGELPPLAGDDSEGFQLYGPAAAAVDTQTAAQSQWIAAALDSESRNFLDFLDAQIQAQAPVAAEEDEAGGTPRPTATFEGLLPPGEHTRVVAAQAFLHVLTLASKNLVSVEQEEGFGEIELTIAVEA
jgi:meiotic recombination protein REC8, fungi type